LRRTSTADLADDSSDGFTAGRNRRIADATIFFKRAFGARWLAAKFRAVLCEVQLVGGTYSQRTPRSVRLGNLSLPGYAGILRRGFCLSLLSNQSSKPPSVPHHPTPRDREGAPSFAILFFAKGGVFEFLAANKSTDSACAMRKSATAPGTTDSHSALIAKNTGHDSFSYSWYWFCAISVPRPSSRTAVFRMPIVLVSNGN
jgi:hypothetical protein